MRVVFPNKKASHQELQQFLEDKFPNLKSAGGFEILRACGGDGGQGSLLLLPLSDKGYTVPNLKERLNSAVAFIRPLQANLDESKYCEEEVQYPVPIYNIFLTYRNAISYNKIISNKLTEKHHVLYLFFISIFALLLYMYCIVTGEWSYNSMHSLQERDIFQ